MKYKIYYILCLIAINSSQNFTFTLTLPFQLMICRDSKCMHLWNTFVRWTECIKPVASILFQFTACL